LTQINAPISIRLMGYMSVLLHCQDVVPPSWLGAAVKQRHDCGPQQLREGELMEIRVLASRIGALR
jgi:hypothetical protein